MVLPYGISPDFVATYIYYRYTLCTLNAAIHIYMYILDIYYHDISSTVIMISQFGQRMPTHEIIIMPGEDLEIQ